MSSALDSSLGVLGYLLYRESLLRWYQQVLYGDRGWPWDNPAAFRRVLEDQEWATARLEGVAEAEDDPTSGNEEPEEEQYGKRYEWQEEESHEESDEQQEEHHRQEEDHHRQQEEHHRREEEEHHRQEEEEHHGQQDEEQNSDAYGRQKVGARGRDWQLQLYTQEYIAGKSCTGTRSPKTVWTLSCYTFWCDGSSHCQFRFTSDDMHAPCLSPCDFLLRIS